MMRAKRPIKLGLSMRYVGYHDAAWRHPEVPAGGASSFAYFLESARAAERAKFDLLFFADGLGVRESDLPRGSLCRSNRNVELEPITLLSALAASTAHIGLVATASTTYNEPFHVARKFASLDHISAGRAGWNCVTSWSEHEAWNFGREQHLDHATRYERANEFVEVVSGLWESWEEGAFIHDKDSGVFFDEAKLHVLDHRGKHFRVRGPLNVDRTPQGRPLIVQAGAGEAGQQLAARYADLVYVTPDHLEAAQRYYASVHARLDACGRHPGDLLVMPALVPVVGRTRAEAQEKLDALQGLVDPLVGLAQLYTQLGDLSGHPLDGPVPEPVDPRAPSIARPLWERSVREGLSIRQLYLSDAWGLGLRVVGTAADVADQMEAWMDGGAADGFNVTPTHKPGGVTDFIEQVIPELRRRGRFRTEYEGATLRENLGLPPVTSRWSGAAR